MQSFFTSSELLPRLDTPRLTLRALRRRDARDMFEYARDPLVSQHVLWDTYVSISQAKFYIKQAKRQYQRGFPGIFAIEHKESGKMIGTIGFMWIQSEHKSAEVGYSLNRHYWNQGYMTEALGALLRYAFDTLQLNRVECQFEVDNPASGRVMEKVGMHYEGTLRQRLRNKGRFVDVKLYAILKKEFKSKKEETQHAAL